MHFLRRIDWPLQYTGCRGAESLSALQQSGGEIASEQHLRRITLQRFNYFLLFPLQPVFALLGIEARLTCCFSSLATPCPAAFFFLDHTQLKTTPSLSTISLRLL